MFALKILHVMVLKTATGFTVFPDDDCFAMKHVGSKANEWNTAYLVGLFYSYTEVHGNNVL